ncbi:hypothetical protein NXS19_002730 [Fusarium pseudograminearum]|nr:hypothetical protein NXS19_002730 [Fusarium pseudograminearum]
MSLSCTTCKFENWNREIETSYKLHHEQCIEKYEDLQKPALLGCPGCILLQEAWVWCIPDEKLRSKAWLTFNIDTSKMYFHLFTSRVIDLDIFTLPGLSGLQPCSHTVLSH